MNLWYTSPATVTFLRKEQSKKTGNEKLAMECLKDSSTKTDLTPLC